MLLFCTMTRAFMSTATQPARDPFGAAPESEPLLPQPHEQGADGAPERANRASRLDWLYACTRGRNQQSQSGHAGEPGQQAQTAVLLDKVKNHQRCAKPRLIL